MNKRLVSAGLVAGLLTVTAFAVAATVPSSEYNATWDASNAALGPHVIEATAYDEAGNTATTHVHVEVWGKGTNPTVLKLGTPSRSAVYLDTTSDSSLLRANLYKTDGTTKLTATSLVVWKYVDGEWHPAGSDDTSATSKAYYAPTAGTYQYRVYPDRTTDYKFVYYGNSYWEHSESPTVTVKAWREVK